VSDPDPADADRPEDGEEGIPRRWLVRLLVGLGVGIPVAIEGRTAVALLDRYLLGGGEGNADDETGTTTSTTTTTLRQVTAGEELLPGTDRTETLRTASVEVEGDTRRLVVTVEVRNTGERAYELRLGAVTAADGTSVAGDVTTGRLEPGESGFVSGVWALPAGSTPAQLSVVSVTYGDDVSRVERAVGLGRVPVQR
jgi:hypothetical protein